MSSSFRDSRPTDGAPSEAVFPRSRMLALPSAVEGGRAPAASVSGLSVELSSHERPYGTPLRAVQDLSFTVPAGQVTAIVGLNGAGKTTTLRALSGTVPYTRGSIDVLGTCMGSAVVGLPQGAAIVPDTPAYPSRWTPRNVMRAHRSTNRPFDVARFEMYLVEHRVPTDRPVGGFSQGQLTQLAVAAALAQDPLLLILDEPFARLDPLARAELLDELRTEMAREDRSMLLSTHDLEGMDRFVDHLVVVAQGCDVLEGEVESLRDEFLLLEQASSEISPRDEKSDAPLIGALTAGGITRGLVHIEEAAGLSPGAHLRRPSLADLITYWLRAATAPSPARTRKSAT